jgi:hypothetical protein
MSIPLFFCSEKVILNARYHAALSEPLQNWLRENDLKIEYTWTQKVSGAWPPTRASCTLKKR